MTEIAVRFAKRLKEHIEFMIRSYRRDLETIRSSSDNTSLRRNYVAGRIDGYEDCLRFLKRMFGEELSSELLEGGD